jgi:hypothetical protein
MLICYDNSTQNDLEGSNLVPRACGPREGTWGSGIIRFREESDWPLKWNAQFNLSQDSRLPATDDPRASRCFPRIAGSGNEIGSTQEIKTSPGTHIQAPKTDFRCHGHDLRSTKHSQTLFRTKFFNMTFDKFSKLSHSNPEIRLDLPFFL